MVGDATLALHATVTSGAASAQDATNRYDDDLKRKSSSKSQNLAAGGGTVENHRGAAAPRERQQGDDCHFAIIRTTYERATGNRWSKPDSDTYEENEIKKIPAEKVVSALEAVTQRTPAKINSCKYFVKEIVALPDPRNRAWQRRQLEKIVRRIRDSSIGRPGYSTIDFLEDVKCACVREGITFDNDIFAELAGRLHKAWVVAMPDGQWRRHWKIHAFVSERLTPGSEFTVFDTPHGCRVGVLICYDCNINENVRITALKGAEILLAPHQTGGCSSPNPHIMGLVDRALWDNRHSDSEAIERELRGPKGRDWLMRWLPSRSHDNGMFLVFSNGIGFEDEVRFHLLVHIPFEMALRGKIVFLRSQGIKAVHTFCGHLLQLQR